jgi:hypothetical protein
MPHVVTCSRRQKIEMTWGLSDSINPAGLGEEKIIILQRINLHELYGV